MKLDFRTHLEASKRTVSTVERDGRDARSVTLSRSFATAVDDLWDALTNAERFPRWFMPISGDLKLGGRYQFEGNAGGLITACEPPSYFKVTWEFGGDVSWVDVRVSKEGEGMPHLALTHTSVVSDHWRQYGPGAVGVGWEMGFLGMALYLAHPDEPKPDGNTFHTFPDGKAFIAGSSDGWGQAAIATGTEPELAEAAARRTFAFYTGELIE